MEEDKLNRIIRQKLENQIPPYQEEFWEQASAQMDLWDKQEKRRKFPFIWFWMLAGLLILSGGSFVAMKYSGIYQDQTSKPSLASALSSSEQLTINDLEENDLDNVVAETKEPESKLAGQLPSSGKKIPTSSSQIKEKDEKIDGKGEKTGLKKYNEGVLALTAMSPEDNSLTPLRTNDVLGIRMNINKRKIAFRQGHMASIQAAFGHEITLPPADMQEPGLSFPNRPSLSIVLGTAASGLIQKPAEGATRRNLIAKDFSVGAELMLPLKKRSYLQTGLHFVSMPLQGVELNAEGTAFSFSSERRQLNWVPDQATYLWVPVRFGKAILPRHKLEAGLSIQRLLGSNGVANTSFINDFSGQINENERLNGISYGMRKWGLATQVGYKLLISKRLYGGIQYHYDLGDLTRDEIFQPNQFDANRGFRFTLQYILR